jgi:hypothetical protein
MPVELKSFQFVHPQQTHGELKSPARTHAEVPPPQFTATLQIAVER